MAKERNAAGWRLPNMRPTLNDTGFMFEVLDEYAEAFIAEAGRAGGPLLEIGCAFGVATLPALAAGAEVVACDMEQGHLDELLAAAPAADRERLECVLGQLPYVDFAPESFAAILCSRVLHFLDGSAIDASLRKMYRWLVPGGRLYLVADTPYGIWRKFAPVFDARLARGERWPGLMIGLENWLPYPTRDARIKGPPFMNLLNPDLLARSCREAGFEVQRASYIDRSDFAGLGRMDGRENAGVLARRPAG
ncbi:MAG: class I SAM-dependent methyltransferase [Gammaproteobacteria bacterium]|nr:MAG: class I SAM-dependent methyltransferase [Gammaproteobacteria bacterium]